MTLKLDIHSLERRVIFLPLTKVQKSFKSAHAQRGRAKVQEQREPNRDFPLNFILQSSVLLLVFVGKASIFFHGKKIEREKNYVS